MCADAADWIADVVTERCPGAICWADPFHVVAWATEALDAERRRAWTDARALARTEPKRGPGRPRKNSAPPPAHERVRKLKGARYALWKNPEDLTDRQTAKLAWIAKTDTRLYRAYLLKEGLRHVFSVKGEKVSRPWTGGSPGRAVAASRCLWNWPAASCATARPSTPPSTTA